MFVSGRFPPPCEIHTTPPRKNRIMVSIHPHASQHDKTRTHTANSTSMAEELRARLKNCQRVVVKAGTSVVSTPEGYPSLVRLANIVEQVMDVESSVAAGLIAPGRQNTMRLTRD